MFSRKYLFPVKFLLQVDAFEAKTDGKKLRARETNFCCQPWEPLKVDITSVAGSFNLFNLFCFLRAQLYLFCRVSLFMDTLCCSSTGMTSQLQQLVNVGVKPV